MKSVNLSSPSSASTSPMAMAATAAPQGAIKLPGKAQWIDPQSLGWLRTGPHKAAGQGILNALRAGRLFPENKANGFTSFSCPAVIDAAGKTVRPVLNCLEAPMAGGQAAEMLLHHVHLNHEGGHQTQWLAPDTPQQSSQDERPIHPLPRRNTQTTQPERRLPGLTNPVRPAPLGPQPAPLNTVVARLQTVAATGGGAVQGLTKKRKNAPSFAARDIVDANKRARHSDSRPPSLHGKTLTFASERFGAGSNGMVCGLRVDNKLSDAYVVKTALMQGDRPSEATLSMLRREIGLNDELSRIGTLKPLPGILIGAGSAELENQLCLLLPRVHGGSLARHLDAQYDDCVTGKAAPSLFTQRLREQLRPVIEGMAVLHDNNFIVNDFNVGNLLHDRIAKHGRLIDFGCAGRTGEFVRPGTVGTIAPERIEASEHAPETPGPRNHPLMPASDAYSMGCVLHYLVHHRYPTWSDKAAALDEEQQLLELSASTPDFLKRGSVFPDLQAAPYQDLRSADPAAEKQLREHLNAAGFYALVNGLTRPDPEKRLTLAQAMESRFLNPASASPV